MPHTKGPWIVMPKDSGFPVVSISGPAPDSVTEARYMPIATVHTYKNTTYPCFYEITEEERDANARIIAAAPELLKHLQHLITCVDKMGLKYTGTYENNVLNAMSDSIRLIQKAEAQ